MSALPKGCVVEEHVAACYRQQLRTCFVSVAVACMAW